MKIEGYQITPELRWRATTVYLPSGGQYVDKVLEQKYVKVDERMEGGLLLKTVNEDDEKWVQVV